MKSIFIQKEAGNKNTKIRPQKICPRKNSSQKKMLPMNFNPAGVSLNFKTLLRIHIIVLPLQLLVKVKNACNVANKP